MSQSEARAWWADVEEVRATIERRRAAERETGDDGRGRDAVADVDDLALRRRFRGRERADADVWFDEPAGARGASAGPRSRASRSASPPPPPADRRAAMAALAPAAPLGAATTPPGSGAPPRRTVQITGRTVPAPHVVPFDRVASGRRGPSRAPAALAGPRPDRIAMWAVVLGFVLIAVAATSAHGATGPVPPSAAPAVQHVAAPAAPAASLRPQRR